MKYTTATLMICCLPLISLSRVTSVRADERPEKPNVVLILADDLGWQDVKCYDIDKPCRMETPNGARAVLADLIYTTNGRHRDEEWFRAGQSDAQWRDLDPTTRGHDPLHHPSDRREQLPGQPPGHRADRNSKTITSYLELAVPVGV